MKVMWLAWPLKKLAKEMNWITMATGGWMDGLAESLTKYYGSECELTLAFAHNFNDKELRGKFNSVGGGNKLRRNTK